MRLPPDLPRLLSKEGARRLALGHLNAAALARHRVATPDQTEGLHDFRVAIRRLRSCLRTYRPEVRSSIRKKTGRRLQRVADTTRESRDLQVHLEWLRAQRDQVTPDARPGLSWMVDRLEREVASAWTAMREQLDAAFPRLVQGLTRELGKFRTTIRLDDSPALQSMARVTSIRLRDAAARLQRQLARVHGFGDERAIHRARIGAKHLRYLLEPFAPASEKGAAVVERLRSLQDSFGEVHDVQVLAATISEALAEAGRIDIAAPPTEGNGRTAPTVRAPLLPGLAALTMSLRHRGTEAFERARSGWLDGAAADFFADVDRAAEAIGALPGRDQEIERKFLLTGVPTFDQPESSAEIEQGYLPGERVIERIRRTRTNGQQELSRTVKEGSGLTRLEVEESLPEDVFARLWPLTEGRRIRKRRYRVRDGDLIWEIDQFHDRNLVVAEVELSSPSIEVTAPAWLRPHVVREVTDDPAYTNFNLACEPNGPTKEPR